MPQEPLSLPLQQFVDEVTSLLAEGNEESSFLPKIGESMRKLVARDDWLDPHHAVPDSQYYQQFLLYADPEDRLSVVSFVWGPGQSTPIHDHTVWGVIGMLRGAEFAQNYEIEGEQAPKAVGDELKLRPGDVEFVSPTYGDVHKVRNALNDQPSISIHAYGGNIGKIKRHVFPAEGGPPKDFISGYSNAG